LTGHRSLATIRATKNDAALDWPRRAVNIDRLAVGAHAEFLRGYSALLTFPCFRCFHRSLEQERLHHVIVGARFVFDDEHMDDEHMLWATISIV
jgi:hypothetical protein